MMMTKFSTICLTILFCISASICAAQSKDTTACLKLEETMQAGEEDAGRRIEKTGRMIEEVQEKVVRQKKAMTAYRKALNPKVRTRRVICWTAAAVLVTALLSAMTVMMRKKYGNSTASPVSDQERKNIEEMTALLTGLLSEKDPESGISKENCARLKKMAGDKRSLISAVLSSYRITHPEFISVLQSHGLTDEDTGYCCLYAAGLNGKDISFLLNNGGRSHYNTASRIRARLGLRESDTNLSIYIRNLLANCDRDSK